MKTNGGTGNENSDYRETLEKLRVGDIETKILDAIREVLAEVERLKAIEGAEDFSDVLYRATQAEAEVERSHNAILALTAEVERLKAELDQARLIADPLVSSNELLGAEVERLKAHIKLLEGYVGNEMYRSDFQTAGHMRAEVERLKEELRFAESRAQALGEMFREAGRFDPSDLVAEVERLKADKRQSIEINAKLSSRVSAALALEPFERWQDCDDLVVSHAELVEALTGGREK